MSILLKKPNGESSVTRTAFVYGFAACLLKLIFSGASIGALHLAEFSGMDFAAAVGALGTVYVLNKPKERPARRGFREREDG